MRVWLIRDELVLFHHVINGKKGNKWH